MKGFNDSPARLSIRTSSAIIIDMRRSVVVDVASALFHRSFCNRNRPLCGAGCMFCRAIPSLLILKKPNIRNDQIPKPNNSLNTNFVLCVIMIESCAISSLNQTDPNSPTLPQLLMQYD